MEKIVESEFCLSDTSRSKFLTTNTGITISNNQDSLKAGERGPTLLEDFILREKITHFDHERIPERVVHARGAGAHGFFQVYEPLTKYSKAQVFQDPFIKTPVFVRFSTVLGSKGSADNVRDVRGFATKFYTQEGNWDLVGNNMPVFFIQDAMKFPDIVHSGKPEPDDEMPQAATAHDNFWDFISRTPEAAHMIMWALSNRALPRSFSTMQGFGVHTFRLINDEDKATFVKFHWLPVKGVHSTLWDETQKISGRDPDFLRRDLFESIQKGNFIEYELGIQFIDTNDENKFDFDLLDPTKIVPEEEVPIKIVGKMTLNRNPDNFFAETEQVAFCTSNIVPGIDFSNDPLLQGRNFSYLDTQLLRLGGPNFTQLPINRPIAPVDNHQRDGYMRMTVDKGKCNYEPNRFGGCPMQGFGHKIPQFNSFPERMEDIKIRKKSPKFLDHYSQATMFFNSLTEYEKLDLINAAKFELGKVKDTAVKEKMIEMFNNIDNDLAVAVATELGLTIPDKRDNYSTKISPSLSQITGKPYSIKGRKVAAIVDDGFDINQLNGMKKALSNENCDLEVIAKCIKIKDSKGMEFTVDKTLKTTASVLYDALFIPGGSKSAKSLSKDGTTLHWIAEQYKHLKPMAFIGEGIRTLSSAAIPGLQKAAEDTSDLVQEVGVMTAGSNSSLNDFFNSFVNEMKLHRHWRRLNHPNYSQIAC